MDTKVLERCLARIGAEVEVEPDTRGQVAITVRRQRRREVISIRIGDPATRIIPIANDREQKHVLLKLKAPDLDRTCLVGFDERHWFVAQVPGNPITVRQAKEQLLSAGAAQALAQRGVRTAKRLKRHNAAYVRQGEWFFIPCPGLQVDPKLIRRPRGGEPFQRTARSTPHRAQECYRTGGRNVYVHQTQVLTEREYRDLQKRKPVVAARYRLSRVGAVVYVRGWIRHPDHKTVHLAGWHRLELNREGDTSRLGFLD